MKQLESSFSREAERTGVCNVRDYGAKTDPLLLQTEAFQKAIDACAAAGGGTVLVPPGIYRIGTIRLRSHVTLRLENGALLRGPDSIDDYFKYPFAWELYSHTMSLIYAVGERNIRICGEGKCIVRNGLRRKGKTVCSQATVFAQTSCFNLIKTLYTFI